MSWEDTMTTIVRHLINDVDSTSYSDDRIQHSIVTAGLLVSQEYTFSNSYTFDFTTPDIVPDPVTEDDTAAMALMTLRASCILDTNKYQGAVANGIRVKDGDSEVDLTAGFKGYRDVIELGPCGAYKKLMKDMKTKQSMGMGKAVVGPFSHEDFNLTGTSFGQGGVQQFFDGLAYR